MNADLLIVIAVRTAFVLFLLLGLTHLVRRYWSMRPDRRRRVHARPLSGSVRHLP